MPDTDNRATQGAETAAPAPRDGWRSQPLGLKILLFASLALVTVGMVRCSLETTAPPPVIDRIEVSAVVADLPEDLLGSPADSVAALVRRMFVRALEGASAAHVAVVAEAGADGAAGPGESGDADALVTLGVRLVRGELAIDGEVREVATGRVLHTIKASGPPKLLHAMIDIAARKASQDLGIAEEALHDHD